MHPAPLHHSRRPVDRRYPPAAVEALACPSCAGRLIVDGARFHCSQGHSFDIAKQGYVALLGARARTDSGDSAEMVAAREQFLGRGHYAPIVRAVAARCVTSAGPVLEVGSGTGSYLRAALEAAGGVGIAIDSSKYAARRAASDHRILSVLADAWFPLPLRPESVFTVLSIFAPRVPAEMARVLAPDGVLVAVTPEPAHLIQLRRQLPMLTVDAGKAQRLAQAFAGLLKPIAAESVEFEVQLSRREVSALVGMGPSARHVDPAALTSHIEMLPISTDVTVAVTVSVFAKP